MPFSHYAGRACVGPPPHPERKLNSPRWVCVFPPPLLLVLSTSSLGRCVGELDVFLVEGTPILVLVEGSLELARQHL